MSVLLDNLPSVALVFIVAGATGDTTAFSTTAYVKLAASLTATAFSLIMAVRGIIDATMAQTGKEMQLGALSKGEMIKAGKRIALRVSRSAACVWQRGAAGGRGLPRCAPLTRLEQR